MTALPARYRFLAAEPGPRMLIEALQLFGTTEAAGKANNAVIVGWAHECGLARIYSHDAIPWCGLFMAVVAKRAGWGFPDSPLWALSWADWGRPSDKPMLGDVLTFKRPGGGHVGLYVGEDAGAFHVLGGNQSDAVTITRIARSRFYRARQAPWRIAPPGNRRVIRMAGNGPLSSNEA
jgi:uncharacterized protein (TIGR02594 family)